MNVFELIENSRSLDELRSLKVLPDPYDDSGYYYIYYAQDDYKAVLPEILSFIENGLRVYYNRYYDRGKSFINDYLAKVKSAHCRCAVIYLSEQAVKDPVFFRLLEILMRTGCSYLSVNLPVNGQILSGEKIAEKYVTDKRRAFLLKTLFKNAVTYIPGSFTLSQKIEELTRAYRSAPMHYSLCGDFAAVDYVYDLQEDNLIIPPSVLLGGKEYCVKAVRRGAFANCENLKKIVFPETIEYIGFLGGESSFGGEMENETVDEEDIFEAKSQINETNGTFYRCKSLQEIVFPLKVKFLYKYEFCGCASLKRILLNEGLKFCNLNDYLDRQGFFDLEDNFSGEVEAEDGCLNGDGEDCGANALDELKVSSNICKTEDGRFKIFLSDANRWIDIDLPAKNICGYSLAKNQENCFIDKFTPNIPDVNGLVRIEYDREWKISKALPDEYCDCTKLIEAVLPDYVENLSGTFAGCVSLKKVKLPENLKYLSQTFEDCTRLTCITLPEGLETIGCDSFKNTALEEVILPSTVICVDGSAFCGCERLHTVISDSKYNKWLFKHKRNRLPEMIAYKRKSTFYAKLFFVYITLPLLHPVAFFTLLFRRKEISEQSKRFFEVCHPKNIYIKEKTGKFNIKGYKKIKSDKAGYFKFIK